MFTRKQHVQFSETLWENVMACCFLSETDLVGKYVSETRS